MASIGIISLIKKPGEMENTYFLNNPDITFFKSVYRKHTNFSKFISLEKYNTDPLTGNDCVFDIKSSDGDLLSKIYLEVVINLLIMKLKLIKLLDFF